MWYIRFLSTCTLGFVLAGTCLADNNPARTEMVFPIFMNYFAGPGEPYYQTYFEVLNPGAFQATVTFRVFDSNGREVFPLRFGSPSNIPVSVNVPGRGANKVYFNDPTFIGGPSYSFPNIIGWVTANVTQPPLGQTQPVIVQEQIWRTSNRADGAPPIFSKIVKPAPLPSRTILQPVRFYSFQRTSGESVRTNTGVAVVFPATSNQISARGVLILRGSDGKTIARTEVSLPGNGQVVKLASELFPIISQTSFYGVIEMNFDQDVLLTGIQITGPQDNMEEPNDAPVEAMGCRQ